MQANTAVALLYQTQELGRHLREALASLGTPIVYEAVAADLDPAALESSGARVVVVNLDPEVEAHLDEVYGLLEDDRYSVVFNDAQVSSELSGWDQARWARHLAAKILGDVDIDPPRPEGAEAVPVPSPAQSVPRAQSPADEADADEIELLPEPETGYDTRLRSIIESAGQEAAAEPARAGDPLDMLESRYDEMNQPAAAAYPSPPAPPEDVFDFSTLEALTAVPSPPEPASSGLADDFLEEPAPAAAERAAAPDYSLEFGDDAAASTGESAATPAAPELGDAFDLDALDKLFEGAPSAAAASPQTPIDVGDLGEPHAVESIAADDEERGVEITLTDLDLAGELPDVPPAPEPTEPAAAEVSPAKLAAAADWSLEDMLEGAAPAPAPTGRADFGIEKLSAAEYLAPATENAAPPPVPDSDFTLELMPMEEAVAPQAVEHEAHEAWLDPDKVVVPSKIRRVWVLGASIGGPEAVREFLGELPRDYPALFLLAQHMGAEFIDLMAQQLAKSTPLTVRTPSHGERVGHGEIVIVPTTHRLQVDPEGIVLLERTSDENAYSPSIDRVLRDVADRYGANASAIIFSGMTTDAVEGSQYLAAKGGAIYAQHPDTCVVSSMIDGVVEAGIVKFLGSPKELAEQLLAEAAKNRR